VKPAQGQVRTLLAILIVSIATTCGVSTKAQSTPVPIDPAVSALAARIAKPLQKLNSKKIVVADLQGPEGQTHPFGQRTASQLSAYLRQNLPNLETIDGLRQSLVANDEQDSSDATRELVSVKEKKWALSLGANILISGSYAKTNNGIGVSLIAVSLDNSETTLAQTNGFVPISNEIVALSPDPVPSPKAGIPRAGIGGVANSTCTRCPPPNYTDEARAAKYQGTVKLQVTVTKDGRAENVIVVSGPGKGLEANAIAAVKKWKFKPALDANGSPVASIVPIQVTFRLY
jgi:TonB family protein